MTVKLPYTNMYINDCDYVVDTDEYNMEEYEDYEGYEEEEPEMYEEDEEEYMWEDEEVDADLEREIRIKLLRASHKKQLEGLACLQGKLKWTENVSDTPILTTEAFPGEHDVKHEKKKYIPKKDHKRLPKLVIPEYKPAKIMVYLRDQSGIGFENTYCQDFKNGKLCTFGDKCMYLHEYKAKKPEPCRNGDKCKYGSKCKFLHEKVSDIGLCKYGKRCKYELCKFSHDMGLCSAIKNRQVCKYGNNCKYSHEISPKVVPKGILKGVSTEKLPSPVVRIPNTSPRTPQEDKKHLLCKNMFTVENGQIKVIGVCKFGAKCMFAHTMMTEVAEKIKNNPTQFKCTDQCKYVTFDFIVKKDKDGKDRKTRRYKNNNESFVCRKTHPNERITDYIVRTWVPKNVNPNGNTNGKNVNKV